jgi:hypothetical protein
MRSPRRDDGVFAILYAALIVATFGMAAIVVDLGQLRADKRDSRTAADTAVLAGASDLGIGPYNPLTACQTAWAFTLENLRLPTTADPCSVVDADGAFVNSTTACPSTPNTATGAVPGSGVTIAITWPVSATSTFLAEPDGKPGLSPRPYQASFDGSALGCDRLAVSIQRERSFGLAAALGATSGVSTARSVSRATFEMGDGDLLYPLVILDNRSCRALYVTAGQVIVRNSGDIPGRIGIDSDGTQPNPAATNTVACSGGNTIIDAGGTNSRITAQNGASGAAAAIEVYGPNTLPARSVESGDLTCGASGPCVSPPPSLSTRRITRAPFDAVYNDDCGGTCPEKAYIERFRAAAVSLTGSPAGWQTISGAGCDTAPPPVAINNRYFVNCSLYRVTGNWAFPPGATVVMSGDLRIDGCLVVNGTAADCTTFPSNGPPYTRPNALLSVRGSIRSGGGPSQLILPQTLLHQPVPTAALNGSGFAAIYWTAPYLAATELAVRCPASAVSTIPPAECFRNLAYWTEAPVATDDTSVRITAGGALTLEGTFFLGRAQLDISGGATVNVRSSQFVAKRVQASSSGALLEFIPNADRTNPVPRRGVALVR